MIILLSELEKNKVLLLMNKIKKDRKIIALYQFGSSLQNTSYKDIDFCLFNSKKLNYQEKQQYLLFLSEHYDLSFFEDLPMYIKHEVLKGKILINKDPDALYDIVFRFIKKYNDFQPHFKKYLELIEEC